MSVSELIKQKKDAINKLKECQFKSRFIRIEKKKWDILIKKERAKVRSERKELRRKRLLKKRARNLSTMSYFRVMYMRQIALDRVEMEQYKKGNNYTCEKCGKYGLSSDDIFNYSGEKDLTAELAEGRVVDKSDIMCHHVGPKEFECLCRWCHDKEDKKLREEGKSFKAVDRNAIIKEVQDLIHQTKELLG